LPGNIFEKFVVIPQNPCYNHPNTTTAFLFSVKTAFAKKKIPW